MIYTKSKGPWPCEPWIELEKQGKGLHLDEIHITTDFGKRTLCVIPYQQMNSAIDSHDETWRIARAIKAALEGKA